MNQNRRDMLRITSVLGLAITAGLINPSEVFAAEWKAGVFEAKSLEDAIKAIGADKFAVSKDVAVNGPDIAENGAVVPVSVTSAAPNTEFIAILVEKNPNPLSASFNIPAGTEAAVSTRVKMGGTSNVHALVKADGKWLIASKEIKVTLGGCGG
ncbi:thiosulfate oxidation carrier protein SoxY [Noviherbaspirillum cavernae]|uniref:Thiosulfate oxidation carrier protein SoxY n=1 Tax=Noviherbaspirillum cavernae TaxID=2320862 RepID=A0A418WZL6_9BURK|nr:thiosulfate oxidation carrier protein SoxY [Noviherbaspirillum cavernae]RJG05690.1 thiosulfate oxidation carrier protein SoxY [Noviherbaspirillum cavernae]